MAIAITEIKRAFRYNGIQLPDVPGLALVEVRDLYSAQYPELISAEIAAGEVIEGVQEFTFRKAVGTKGAKSHPVATPRMAPRLAALLARIDSQGKGADAMSAELSQAMSMPSVKARSQAWTLFAQYTLEHDRADTACHRITATSEMLAPLP